MPVPQTALEHYRRQQLLTAAALRAARREKSPRRVAEVVVGFQLAAALDAARSVDLMVDEAGGEASPLATPVPTSLAGVASDGRPLVGLFEQASSEYALGLMVATQVQDAARVLAGIRVATLPEWGYARMLNTPSCSRCVILAGRWYRWNRGFQRHPRCDCRHIPQRESSRDPSVSPVDYFNSLSEAERDRTFTKAGAQAIRDGADMNQVVNARRGMETAQRVSANEAAAMASVAARRAGASGTAARQAARDAYAETAASFTGPQRALRNRDGLYVTDEGGSMRGRFTRTQDSRVRSGDTFTRTRLMPESIYDLAGDDREEAVRLLKLHGYVS